MNILEAFTRIGVDLRCGARRPGWGPKERVSLRIYCGKVEMERHLNERPDPNRLWVVVDYDDPNNLRLTYEDYMAVDWEVVE